MVGLFVLPCSKQEIITDIFCTTRVETLPEFETRKSSILLCRKAQQSKNECHTSF